MQFEFKLPDIGEGVAEGEIIKWMVKEGDEVSEDQSLVEVMTDKVNVQIPSPRKGKVSRVLAREGDVVKVGQGIVVIETSEGAPPESRESRPDERQQGSSAPLEGRAERADSAARSTPRAEATQLMQAPPQTRALATPATRRLARELGVDLDGVRGSGPAGRVTDEDVRRAAVPAAQGGGAQSAGLGTLVTPPSPAGGASTGPATVAEGERRIPIRGVRKAVAERMVKSAQTAPHVTHVEEVDATELVLLKEAFKGSAEKRGVKLTFLPFLIKAIVPALRDFPHLNSTLDDRTNEIVLKPKINFGIATDTDQGLVVPVVRDVEGKDVFEISTEIEALAERARTGQLALDEVRGSTITITNIGAIGGLFATPIINYPEVAIIGTYRITKRPVVRDGGIEVRDMMYVSLTFDHRVVDGAYAARFMRRVIDTIQDPKKLLAEIL